MSALNIGVFTGNRAEYGLLRPLIEAIAAAPDMTLRLFVGGALLNEKYGRNLEQIEAGGVEITAQIDIPEPGSNEVSTAGAIARAITQCEEAFLGQNLDGIFVYADRYEGFAAVIAASHSNIPVLHIEGGDITEGGAFDDNVRHSMSKLSHLHFPSNEMATDVLKEMGEEEWRILNVGLLPFANLDFSGQLDPETLQMELGFELSEKIVLFTLHSISSSVDQTKSEAQASFKALREIAKNKNTTIIVTFPNDDNGSDVILQEIEGLSQDVPNAKIVPSLGQKRYYGILHLGAHGYDVVCMGNTSSIVKECVFFCVPGILIGTRQDGRLVPGNVCKAPANVDQIVKIYEERSAIQGDVSNPYFVKNGVHQALDHLRRYVHDPRLLKKKYER